ERTIPTRVGRTRDRAELHQWVADHPHARGENPVGLGIPAATTGPSPRAWGEPHRDHAEGAGDRTIPTRVGRTCTLPNRSGNSSDHPHARGENVVSGLRRWYRSGPSPRAWGERLVGVRAGSECRTIPTRVGRTRGSPRAARPSSDHPHARGENVPA